MLKNTNLENDVFKDEEHQTSAFKVCVWAALSSLAIMITVTILVFFMTVAPKDEIMMPKVVGLPLSEAILLLQENDLYVNIEMKFTENKEDSGFVLEQKPASNSWIKGQRMVHLVVSRGMIINIVPDFKGQTLEDLKQTLLTTFGDNLLFIKEPIIYAFDDNPSGTIIGQRPDPGLELAKNTPLELIVSRGPNVIGGNIAKNFVGTNYLAAMEILAKDNTPFNFVALDQFDIVPKVITQAPLAGSALSDSERINLSISRPSPESLKGQVFGIFSYDIPQSTKPMTVEASIVTPNNLNNPQILFVTIQQNVTLTIPYLAPAGSELVIKLNNNESLRHPIR